MLTKKLVFLIFGNLFIVFLAAQAGQAQTLSGSQQKGLDKDLFRGEDS